MRHWVYIRTTQYDSSLCIKSKQKEYFIALQYKIYLLEETYYLLDDNLEKNALCNSRIYRKLFGKGSLIMGD